MAVSSIIRGNARIWSINAARIRNVSIHHLMVKGVSFDLSFAFLVFLLSCFLSFFCPSFVFSKCRDGHGVDKGFDTGRSYRW